MSQAPSDESPTDQAFRAEARAFLEAHAKPRDTTADLATTLGRTDISPEAEAEHVQECRDWQATLTANGWAGIAWATEYGGRGGTPSQAKIFAQEEHDFVVSSGAFAIAIGMVGPTIIAHGTDAQKDTFLPRILRGEDIWCQLFSEPGAGSDLAGLATRAEQDGDEWVVNGQKVWTSGAHFSDWGILLARNYWDAHNHLVITYIHVNKRTHDIEIRPLRQIAAKPYLSAFLPTP